MTTTARYAEGTPVFEVEVAETRVLYIKRVSHLLGGSASDALIRGQVQMDNTVDHLNGMGPNLFTEWELSPAIGTPAERLLAAFKLAPELKTMIGDLIYGADNDLIQPMIDRCNAIVKIVGRETFVNPDGSLA